ncbi:nucleotidyl transferase AbiEii/AbiGii toxin family protein, partial [Vibrio cholerae]
MKYYDENMKNKIRKLIIIGIFSEDIVLEHFALKGGNALAIGHNINERASMDIDVSMKD